MAVRDPGQSVYQGQPVEEASAFRQSGITDNEFA